MALSYRDNKVFIISFGTSCVLMSRGIACHSVCVRLSFPPVMGHLFFARTLCVRLDGTRRVRRHWEYVRVSNFSAQPGRAGVLVVLLFSVRTPCAAPWRRADSWFLAHGMSPFQVRVDTLLSCSVLSADVLGVRSSLHHARFLFASESG